MPMHERQQRQFTVAEANALLGDLSRQLERLRELKATAARQYEEMRSIREVGYRADGNLIMLTDYQNAKREFDRVVGEANRIVAEVHALGCRITDVEMGLVDFPATLGNQPVHLCWKLGEPEVLYYHEPQEGYRGRRPLPPAWRQPAED
ncbi:MAG: DUF2203 domain-containing protein [Firmicutes bacterium]|nr:DUF2203 domain-containing protein [Bacillota bacterium]